MTTQTLGQDFWSWRASQQPRSHDDIPRIARPGGWRPRWSVDDVAGYRRDLAGFESRLAALPDAADRAEMVDRRLLGSAIARVRWELDILRMWQTQPRFYVDQTIGVVFDLLTEPAPDAARLGSITAILDVTAEILDDARANLTDHAVAEFAQLAVTELADVHHQIPAAVAALAALPAARGVAERLVAAGEGTTAALVGYRDWLAGIIPTLAPMRAVGRETYQWFLTEVALIPSTPEEILATGRVELDRAVSLETLERNRNRHSGQYREPAPRRTAEDQSAAEAEAELAVRRFYTDRCLLGQPDSLRHYLNAPLPDYLAPLRWLGVTDDLTGPGRLDQDGLSYVPTFPGEAPYFYAANAVDPRAGIVHEGAHYQQLALSWRHPNPVRRHYYDSGPNEGIAFYNEELMLASGLFDDSPATREIMYNFMRLRALRVEVDVRLAVGDLDIDGAADFLRRVVPMDAETAQEEAAFFAACPGQALTYQIGKTQILRLFADTVRADATDFNLQRFHDRLWLEGNVPVALQRWELLDDDTDLRRIDRLRVPLVAEPDNGLTAQPLVTAGDTDGALSLTRVEIDGRHQSLRSNASTRVYYVLDGILTVVVGDGPSVTVDAGGHAIVPRGVSYSVGGSARYLVLNGPAFREGDDEYV
jgi:mannose-6-phosphate isomerase-like protein (cupin superfamily)